MVDPGASQPQEVTPNAPAMDSGERESAMVRNREQARQARRGGAMAKILAARAVEAPPVETAAQVEAVAPVEAPKPAPAPKPVEAAKSVEVAPPAPPVDDAAERRGLANLEHQRKRFLEERQAAQAELEVQRAEVARLRQEAQGKVSSIEDMKKLDLSTLLDKLALDDAKLAQLSRESYYRTAEGQKNPSAKQAVEEIRQRSSVSTMESQLAELRKELAETKEAAAAAQKLVFQREYVNEWTEGALKEVPADKPTHFAKLYAKDPRTAKQQLIMIGSELEKEAGAAPSASEVLAEYERRERAFLESRGYDPDLVLSAPKPAASAAPAAPPKPPMRTLNPTAPQVTRPEQAPKTREELRQNAMAKLRMRQRSTADQVS